MWTLLPLEKGKEPTDRRRTRRLAAPLFWTDQGASFAFPGAKCLEAEFPEKVPRVKGVWINERFASDSMLAQIAAGYTAERQHGT